MRHIIENISEGEVLVRVDFSENYACKYFTEAQSVHFGASRQQVSIHTGVLYYAMHHLSRDNEKQSHFVLYQHAFDTMPLRFTHILKKPSCI